ncbi:hypothetical protein NECID01_0586 [Nematocida sp. AWRm77]|nr:hypothetical protein NECID01_0586 [Nematocida sp. AWRm77]
MKKRTKERRSSTQSQFLSLLFSRNANPSSSLRKQIAEEFGMSPRSVQVWFQNRRAKEKKARKEEAVENIPPVLRNETPFLDAESANYIEYFSMFSQTRHKE